MTTITLAEYAVLLRWHDWTFEFSDDFSVWKRGSSERGRLRDYSHQSQDHTALFQFACDKWGA